MSKWAELPKNCRTCRIDNSSWEAYGEVYFDYGIEFWLDHRGQMLHLDSESSNDPDVISRLMDNWIDNGILPNRS